MKKKTAAIFFLAVLMAVQTAGCGNESRVSGNEEIEKGAETAEVSVSETEEKEEGNVLADKKIGVCIYQFNDSFMTLFRSELESYLINQGFLKENIFILDGKNDMENQTQQLDKLIADGVDVLIMNPVKPSLAGEITDKAVAAGIPLVFINREPEETEVQRWSENDWKVTYVGCDNRQSGIYQGEMIAELGLERLDRNGNGKVDYVMVQGDAESNATYLRTQYSVQVLTDAGFEVNCLAEGIGDWQQVKGRRIVTEALAQYGDDVEVVFCNSDAMAIGALEAIETVGRTPGEDIYVVGVDALSKALESVLEGKMVGTVLNDHFSQSHAAADAAIRYIVGEDNAHYITCDYVKVTKDNAEDLLDMVK